ncbi:hypothetical protein KIPB_004326, partial [Kipferlia bialata]
LIMAVGTKHSMGMLAKALGQPPMCCHGAMLFFVVLTSLYLMAYNIIMLFIFWSTQSSYNEDFYTMIESIVRGFKSFSILYQLVTSIVYCFGAYTLKA